MSYLLTCQYCHNGMCPNSKYSQFFGSYLEKGEQVWCHYIISCKICFPCSENCSSVGSLYHNNTGSVHVATLWNILMTIVGLEMQEWFPFILFLSYKIFYTAVTYIIIYNYGTNVCTQVY